MQWKVSPDLKQELKMSDDKALQKLLRRVLKYFHRTTTPTFIGHISLDVGLSLRQVQLLVDFLVSVGDLRKATAAEVVEMGVDLGSSPEIYALTAGAKVWLAHD